MEPYAAAGAVLGVVMALLTTRELLRRKITPPQYFAWMFIWVTIILTAAVPQFYSALLVVTQGLGMYTPIHFVTTFSVLALFVIAYYLGKRISELDDKLSTIVQNIALQTSDSESRLRRSDDES